MLRHAFVAVILVSGLVVSTASAVGSETGWVPVIVARGELKQQIESTPIVERPNRPFHFYGNTVRRQYYRSQGATAPREFVQSSPTPAQK
jgi:hypothetical protein